MNLKINNFIHYLILLIPIVLCVTWHYFNNALPSADAVGWFQASFEIYNPLKEYNLVLFIDNLFTTRPWRPIIFHLFILPFLILSGGEIFLTMLLVNTFFVIISVFFLYKIFNIYSNKINAAISASIVGSTIHVIFGGIGMPMFAELSLATFFIGSIYCLYKSNYFSDKYYSYLYATFVFLCFATRPVESALIIIPPLLAYIFIMFFNKKVNISIVITAFASPVLCIFILLLSRYLYSSSIASVNPPHSLSLYKNISNIFFIFTCVYFILFIFIIYTKRPKKTNLSSQTYLFKSLLFLSFCILVWWYPYFSNLYEWIYRTSFGDIVSHYATEKDLLWRSKNLLNAFGIGTLIYLLALIFYSYVYSEKKKYNKFDEMCVMLVSSIPLPLMVFFFSIQYTTRKISQALLALFIFLIVIILKKNASIKYTTSPLAILLVLISFANFNFIYNTPINQKTYNIEKTFFEKMIIPDFPAPVKFHPNPHYTVIENIKNLNSDLNLKNIAVPIDENSQPVDPFTLMLLALEQDFSVSFPYVRKFNEEDLSFLSHYDAILLINPLGKMNDSYEQKEILKLIYTLEYKKLDLKKYNIKYIYHTNLSPNQRYTFYLQYLYSIKNFEKKGWKKISCFDIDHTYDACLFHQLD